MSTPVTCTKAGEVILRACLNPPFVGHTIYPNKAASLSAVRINGIDNSIVGYANWIDDGTNQSFKTNLADPTNSSFGGLWGGTKFLCYTQAGGDYYVGTVAHAATDPDTTSGPSLTVTNVGDGGASIPMVGGEYVGFVLHLNGPSLAGGDEISWFEDRGDGDIHFLTSDGTSLTREQAFQLEGSETFATFTLATSSWLSDGTYIWLLASNNVSPYNTILVRFAPTAIGDPFSFQKYAITFSDPVVEDAARDFGSFISATTANTFIFEFSDFSQFDRARHLEVSKDGTSYTEYFVTGNSALEDFVVSRGCHLFKTGTGANRLISQNFSGPYAVGTYDLTCSGATNQGHCYARKRTRKSRANEHGFLIPSGDMNDGGDFLITSGDAGGGRFKWQRVKTDD